MTFKHEIIELAETIAEKLVTLVSSMIIGDMVTILFNVMQRVKQCFCLIITMMS